MAQGKINDYLNRPLNMLGSGGGLVRLIHYFLFTWSLCLRWGSANGVHLTAGDGHRVSGDRATRSDREGGAEGIEEGEFY